LLKKPRVNSEIRIPEVRLIDENGKQLGVLSNSKALKIAQEKGLDLVEVSPNSKPPVCRIINFDKYRYRLAKKEKKQKSHTKQSQVKGIRIGSRTGPHDLEFKKSRALKFLKEGNKIRIDLILKGRERYNKEMGRKVITEFIEKIEAEVPLKIEQSIQSSPRGLSAVVVKKS